MNMFCLTFLFVVFCVTALRPLHPEGPQRLCLRAERPPPVSAPPLLRVRLRGRGGHDLPLPGLPLLIVPRASGPGHGRPRGKENSLTVTLRTGF